MAKKIYKEALLRSLPSPTNPKYLVGHKVKVIDGTRFKSYILDSSRQWIFDQGITDDQEERLERLNDTQISKLEDLKTQEDITNDINTAVVQANGTPIEINGTVLPLGNAIPSAITVAGTANLYGEALGTTYTQAGKPSIVVSPNKFRVGYYNRATDTWTASVKEYDVPKGADGASLLELWSNTSPNYPYKLNVQVRDVENITHISLKANNTSALTVTADWLKIVPGIKDLGTNPNLDDITTKGVYSFTRILGAGGTSTLKGTERNILFVADLTSTRSNEVYQFVVSNSISFRKKTTNGWEPFKPYTNGLTEINESIYPKGKLSWNVINPTALRKCDLVLWGESGLIAEGTADIYAYIPVETGIEYVSKSGNFTIWCYDADKKPIVGTKASGTTFTFTGATRYISITSFLMTPRFGKNVPADYEEPFSVRIDKRDVIGFPAEDYVGTVGNAKSLYDAGITAVATNYVLQKRRANNYTVKTKFNINNMHNEDLDIPLITVNNGIENVVKVELLNRKATRGFGVSTINTKLRITTKQEVTERDVTGIVNQMAGRDVFSVRRVDPNFTEYKFMQGGVYNPTLDIANYTLMQEDLGWVLKVDAVGVSVIRYNITLSNDILTIGTDVLETISIPYNNNESLDDYLKRLPNLLGNKFEVRTRFQDASIKCTHLVHGEMQMCRWFKPLQTQFRRMDVPNRLMSVYIIDAYPCQVQIQRQTDFELILSYYNNAGWYNHYLLIDDLIVLRDRRTVQPVYSGDQTITYHTAGIQLSSMSHNLTSYYSPIPIIAFTGHWHADLPEFQLAGDAATQLGYRTTIGRTTYIMNKMKAEGFEQTTIEEFMKMKAGMKPWKKSFFWCMDDSITILTSNGTLDGKIGTHQKLLNMSYAFTAGINLSSMDGTFSAYEAPLTQVDVDFYKQYGELFNHSYFHSSHDYLTALQLIYFLDKHEQLARLHGLKVQRMYAFPFNEAKYFNARMIRSYGYPAITSHFGANSSGAIFKGTNDCNLSRITVDDLVSKTQVDTAVDNVGIMGGRYVFY